MKVGTRECSTFLFVLPVMIFAVVRKHNRRTEGAGREDGSVADTNDDKVGLLTSALMEEELEENMSV